jgi:hypothetical protein
MILSALHNSYSTQVTGRSIRMFQFQLNNYVHEGHQEPLQYHERGEQIEFPHQQDLISARCLLSRIRT